MARMRTLKPEFFDSPSTAEADLAVRLTFMAMWSWADDSGHGTGNLKELEAFCWPNDEVTELPRRSRGNSAGTPGGWRNFAEICGEVAEVFGVVFYKVRNRPYYWIPSFKQHQSKDFRPTSRYPLLEEGEMFDVTSGNVIGSGSVDTSSGTTSAPMRGNSADAPGDPALVIGEQGNRGTGEQGMSADAATAPPEPQPVREDVEQICEAIALHVHEQTGKQPTITKKWRDSARLLIDRDGFTLEQITWIIRWVAGHDFWSAVILSAPKLREKFPNLVAQAKRDGTPKVDKAAQMILADRLRREASTDTPKEIEQ